MPSRTVYFELMSAGKRLGVVSARAIAHPDLTDTPVWAYEVRYTDKTPQRGTFIAPQDIEELKLMSIVLKDYFAKHHHSDTVPA